MEPTTSSAIYEDDRDKPVTSRNHGLLQGRFITELNNTYEVKYNVISELSLSLDGWEVVPDISIFPARPIDYSVDEIKVTEAPLCVIEILSPTQTLQDLTIKADLYFTHGVKSFWLVIPVFKNVYVYAERAKYQMFTENDTLEDPRTEVTIPLNKIFI